MAEADLTLTGGFWAGVVVAGGSRGGWLGPLKHDGAPSPPELLSWASSWRLCCKEDILENFSFFKSNLGHLLLYSSVLETIFRAFLLWTQVAIA